ncbi:MAG: response regulator transcription factor [Arthrobacter sp.]|jgi:DNA-binding NarL/FixJ family response regulator|nr:response regulator transcription factor [Arthrobacter sp.]
MRTLLLVDDHAAVRSGLRLLLEASGLRVLGEAADGATGASMATILAPDVVLMDVRMPGTDGIEGTRRIVERGGPPVLILTTFDLEENVEAAIRAGAAGYILKTAEAPRILEAIDEVVAGRGFVDPAVVPALFRRAAKASHAPAVGQVTWPPSELTPRELDVLRLLAGGLSNRALARKLGLAETTIKSHVSGVLAKLGLESRVQAALWFTEHAPREA